MEGQAFAVFDVETPNRRNDRMSAIGITLVEGGRMAGDFYSLVNPEAAFDPFNTRLTGISEGSVRDAPTFPELWPRIEPLLGSGTLVAHNATFDLGVLRKCLLGYGIRWRSEVRYACTVRMGREALPGLQSHRLDALCDHYGISLDHHHAGSDSHACAEILTRCLRAGVDIGMHTHAFSLMG